MLQFQRISALHEYVMDWQEHEYVMDRAAAADVLTTTTLAAVTSSTQSTTVWGTHHQLSDVCILRAVTWRRHQLVQLFMYRNPWRFRRFRPSRCLSGSRCVSWASQLLKTKWLKCSLPLDSTTFANASYQKCNVHVHVSHNVHDCVLSCVLCQKIKTVWSATSLSLRYMYVCL